MVTGLKVQLTEKADLDMENKIVFYEHGTPHPEIYAYNLPPGSRVIIVDDEIATGGTIKNLAQALIGNGHEVVAAVVPVESTSYNARESLKQIGVKLISHTKHEMD